MYFWVLECIFYFVGYGFFVVVDFVVVDVDQLFVGVVG